MNELNELDLGIHVYYCAITQMHLNFSRLVLIILTLDYNIRKAVHRIYIYIYTEISSFTTLQWGSLRLAPIILFVYVHGAKRWRSEVESNSKINNRSVSLCCWHASHLLLVLSCRLSARCRTVNRLLYLNSFPS